jgi:hypothetical protein
MAEAGAGGAGFGGRGRDGSTDGRAPGPAAPPVVAPPVVAAVVDGRGEHPLQKADRNMIELLQELRVAQTGVQILFAFLLSLSFTERFGRIDDFQRWTYVVTLLLTSVTSGLLVAPAAIHRMLFGRGVKAVTVRIGHRLFMTGLAALALTLVGAVLLVLDVVMGRTFAVWAAMALGVVLVGLWFVLPLPVRARNDRDAALASGRDGDDADRP